MSSPTDKEIKKATAEILQRCDISSTSLKTVRKLLEEKFGCSLGDQKEVIYEAFEKFLAKNEAVIQYTEIVDAEIKHEEEIAEAEDAELLPMKKKSKGGFGAEVHLAPDLAAFLGTELLPRTEVTKRIWAYIKENDLQDPADKRMVVCDAELEKVMKRKTVHMFKMTKILSAMMMKPNEVNYGIEEEEDEGSDNDSADKPTSKRAKKDTPTKAKAKATTAAKNGKSDKKADKKTDKKRKSDSPGDDKDDKDDKRAKKQTAYKISDKLQSLLGLAVDDTRYQVVAKMWEYIRGHDLQNPADKREVRLDKPLQDIFKVKTFTIFSMNKHISTQMLKNDA